jgi:hypothetical protein
MSASQAHNESASEFILKTTSKNKLLDTPVSHRELLEILMHGLREEYAPLLASNVINSTNDMMTLCNRFEGLLANRAKSSEVGAISTRENVKSSQGSENFTNIRNNSEESKADYRKQIICYFCGKKGHIQAKCYKRMNMSASQGYNNRRREEDNKNTVANSSKNE